MNILEKEEQFAEVYNRFRTPILNYVLKRVADVEAAHELTQEVFLKAFRFRFNYKGEYAVSTWLWTIAKNVVTDFFRKGDDLVLSSGDGDDSPISEVACSNPDPEAALSRKSDRRSLLKIARKLTRLQKRVVWMRLIHHLSYQEVADKLGLSLSSVKCLAYRSRQVLVQLGNPQVPLIGL